MRKLLLLLWGLNALLVLLMVSPLSELAAVFKFFGRLHPLLLHFPIALLLVAFLFELIAHRTKKEAFEEPATLLLWLGAYSAVISALAGYLLAESGNYAGNTFAFHQWFGLATSLLAATLIQLKSIRPSYLLGVYAVLSLLLVVTGHYGASLTHGEDFLTQDFKVEQEQELVQTEAIFSQMVQPILEKNCVSCHNPNKLEGKLSLESQTDLLKGGESGAILNPGDLVNSNLLSYLLLPEDDELHMPPKGKSQLTKDEIEMISFWVKSGASFEEIVAEIPEEDPIQVTIANYFSSDELSVDFASAELIASLNSELFSVKQIAEDSPWLEVYMGQNKSLSKGDLKKLDAIAEQIYSLDLGGSQISKSMLKQVAEFENLSRLYLDNTELSDGMLKPLKDLDQLSYLNLYGTEVTAKGAKEMLSIAQLEQLYLWQSQVDEASIAELRIQFPTVIINGGSMEEATFGAVQLNPPSLFFESSFFSDKMVVEAPYGFANSKLYYQIDNGEPQLVENDRIEIDKSAKLTVYAEKEGWKNSESIEQSFIQVRKVDFTESTLQFEPNGQYQGKGVSTLFDLAKGSENFKDGQWLGFNGDDMVVDLALPEAKSFSSVYISTLDDVNSWIFPPKSLEIWGGNEASALQKISSLTIAGPEAPETKNMVIHQLKFEPNAFKYFKIIARNYGALPEWHPGKQSPAYMFIDEIALQ